MESAVMRPIELLLVEDSEPDVRLTVEALREKFWLTVVTLPEER